MNAVVDQAKLLIFIFNSVFKDTIYKTNRKVGIRKGAKKLDNHSAERRREFNDVKFVCR